MEPGFCRSHAQDAAGVALMAGTMIRRRRTKPATTRTPMLCFSCKAFAPAGSSARCEACQPVDTRFQPHGRQAVCARCDRTFSSVTAFDLHQQRHTECVDPATISRLEMAVVNGHQI
jgi:hypothetical protein